MATATDQNTAKSASGGISTFDQFVKFSTDASGLERTFRALQAITQILATIEPARQLVILLVSLIWPPITVHPSSQFLHLLSRSTLSALRTRFALGRRFFRVFRFLDAFSSAWKLFVSPEKKSVETWLDISSRSFNGLYLLLETAHFPEALAVDGFRVWGAETAKWLHVEGQRFWFFALVCGVGAGLVRLVALYGNDGVSSPQFQGKGGDEDEEKRRRVVERRRRSRRRVIRRLAADVMDLALPGAVVGWIPASPGVVGLLMLGSTYLTGLEVWERCGRS
ncbi:peroxisomal biogenesis factor 11-domain-containing protein [Apodospora peruviana]|uniref:Peroxisomal biogenesis factor 11-domain-containing protein n=1 Tax=Apodospora peruviana TaxID=516989 RepID=A0AAE0I0F0_9PEZI|nr:peroxisomal biogenesis factor 11-domain-containing protein [Apodospora peruviana]